MLRLQRRVAFLPFVRATLKSLISKNYDFEPKSVGEHIKRRRLLLGLLQKDVAALFNVRTETVHNWEIGYTKPTIQLIPTLVNFLGYDPEPQNPETVGDRLRSKRRQLGFDFLNKRLEVLALIPAHGLTGKPGAEL
jgi:transcriptional regulator with XRE-family HTH domain